MNAPTLVDEAIARRDEIIREAEGARVGAAWMIEHAAELAAMRVGRDYRGDGTLLHKVGCDDIQFFVYGEDQTSRFLDAIEFLSKCGSVEINVGENYTHVEAEIEDTRYRVKFMFDRPAIDEDALNSAEGKV